MSKAAELANLIGNINAGGGGVNRNLVINGAMNVSQRGTSFSFTDATLCLDRFVIAQGNSSSAATITQDSSAPDGFSNSLKVDVTTADTSLAVNHIDQMIHRIEAQNLQQLAFGTSSAKNFTLSFYVKSNKTGNYSVNIGQQDNSYKQANLLYTINSANTWERKSLTFTGDTSGVINDDNGSGFEIAWILAAGTTYTSGSNSASFSSYANANYAANHGVNVFDSTDNTWFLTGVQLEIGQNATEFEHEPIERTLDKCRRYTFVMGGDGIYERFAVGYQQSSTQARCVTFYPTTMRANPTTSKTDPLIVAHRSTAQSVSSISVDYNSKTVGHIQYNVSSGLNAGEGCHIVANNNANARLTFDAEL